MTFRRYNVKTFTVVVRTLFMGAVAPGPQSGPGARHEDPWTFGFSSGAVLGRTAKSPRPVDHTILLAEQLHQSRFIEGRYAQRARLIQFRTGVGAHYHVICFLTYRVGHLPPLRFNQFCCVLTSPMD